MSEIAKQTIINMENDPVYWEIIAAKLKLNFHFPFYGMMSSRLEVIDASKWCDTAATDGRNLYYNREFIKSLSKAKLMFLLAHEVEHCIRDHLGRREGRDPKIWNMANDYIINDSLIDEKIGEMPENGLLDPRFKADMASEEVYDILKKSSVTIKMNFDEHLQLGDDDEGEGSGQQSVEVTVMGRDGPPKLSEEDLKKIRADIMTQAVNAAQVVMSQAGTVPAGIQRLITQLVAPKLDWRAMLDATIRSQVKGDFTFSRMSRGTWAQRALAHMQNLKSGRLSRGFIMPAQDFLETIEIDVAIDASGSMSEDMLRDLLSEVKGIATTFGEFKIRVLTFDTQVYNVKSFDQMNVDEIDTYELGGGGGTKFRCCWDYYRENDIDVKRCVLFTDGYDSEPDCFGQDNNNPAYDVLYVIHGDKSRKIIAPHGATAYYDPD